MLEVHGIKTQSQNPSNTSSLGNFESLSQVVFFFVSDNLHHCFTQSRCKMKQDVTLVSTAQLYARYQTRIGALTSLKRSITQLCSVTFDEITVKPILFPQYTQANNLYWMLATIRLCAFYVSTLAAEKMGQFICGSWNTSSTLDAYRGGSLF